jgi:hypothetical protein
MRFFTAHSHHQILKYKINDDETEVTSSLHAGYEKLIQTIIRKLKVQKRCG